MKAVFHRRSLVWSMALSLMIILTISMNLMFLSIMAGMPIFVSMAVLFGGIILGIGILGGEATYTVDKSGLTQEIRPLSWFKLIPKNIYRHFRWEEIAWYRQGSDMNRSFQEYFYLKIKLRRWPYSLQITSDKADPVQYAEFEKLFMQYADGVSLAGMVHDQVERPHSAEVTAAPLVHRKPDFYQTTAARMLFWLFSAAFIGIIYFMNYTGIIKGSYIFRFLFIIIPGMGYFYYRIFVKGRRRG